MSTNATGHDVLIGCVQFSFVSFSVYRGRPDVQQLLMLPNTCVHVETISLIVAYFVHNDILDHNKKNTCIQNWRKPEGSLSFFRDVRVIRNDIFILIGLDHIYLPCRMTLVVLSAVQSALPIPKLPDSSIEISRPKAYSTRTQPQHIPWCPKCNGG